MSQKFSLLVACTKRWYGSLLLKDRQFKMAKHKPIQACVTQNSNRTTLVKYLFCPSHAEIFNFFKEHIVPSFVFDVLLFCIFRDQTVCRI